MKTWGKKTSHIFLKNTVLLFFYIYIANKNYANLKKERVSSILFSFLAKWYRLCSLWPRGLFFSPSTFKSNSFTRISLGVYHSGSVLSCTQRVFSICNSVFLFFMESFIRLNISFRFRYWWVLCYHLFLFPSHSLGSLSHSSCVSLIMRSFIFSPRHTVI